MSWYSLSPWQDSQADACFCGVAPAGKMRTESEPLGQSAGEQGLWETVRSGRGERGGEGGKASSPSGVRPSCRTQDGSPLSETHLLVTGSFWLISVSPSSRQGRAVELRTWVCPGMELRSLKVRR